MKKTRAGLATVLVLAVSCTGLESRPRQASVRLALPGVHVTFDHRGAAPNRWALHFAETGTPNSSAKPGEDYWLRLTNDSGQLIAVETQSQYMAIPLELVPVSSKNKAPAVKNNSEISAILWTPDGPRYIGDTSSISYMPTGRSVIFDVPRELLRKSAEIAIRFRVVDPSLNQESDDFLYGVTYRWADLPRSAK